MKIRNLLVGAVALIGLAGAAYGQSVPTFDPSGTVIGREDSQSKHVAGVYTKPQSGDYGNVDTDCPSGVCRAFVPVFANYEPTYQLLGVRGGAAATVTGAAQGPVYGATYVYRVMGTFTSCTENLQVLDADGVTFTTVFTSTAAATTTVTIGNAPVGSVANVRVQLVGTCAVWASLS